MCNISHIIHVHIHCYESLFFKNHNINISALNIQQYSFIKAILSISFHLKNYNIKSLTASQYI